MLWKEEGHGMLWKEEGHDGHCLIYSLHTSRHYSTERDNVRIEAWQH